MRGGVLMANGRGGPSRDDPRIDCSTVWRLERKKEKEKGRGICMCISLQVCSVSLLLLKQVIECAAGGRRKKRGKKESKGAKQHPPQIVYSAGQDQARAGTHNPTPKRCASASLDRIGSDRIDLIRTTTTMTTTTKRT